MSRTDADRVRGCLGDLERTDRYVVLMYFADELTPAEIGLVLDVSLRRVNRVIDTFRQSVAAALTEGDRRRDAQRYVSDWMQSPRSALV
ncbi:MAG: sigma factor-like helix-turn-helix DNA-binding protein [Planctomycetota bacterium]